MVGCLGNLYDGIENLDDSYILSPSNKDMLLNPTVPNYSANVPLLLPNLQTSTSSNLYRCSCHQNAYCRANVATVRRSAYRKNVMNKSSSSSEGKGGYVKGLVIHMIMDDLVVIPVSTISSITLLNKFKVKDVVVLEDKVIDIGMDEGVKLLRASLQFKEVLTDVFLKKKVAK